MPRMSVTRIRFAVKTRILRNKNLNFKRKFKLQIISKPARTAHRAIITRLAARFKAASLFIFQIISNLKTLLTRMKQSGKIRFEEIRFVILGIRLINSAFYLN